MTKFLSPKQMPTLLVLLAAGCLSSMTGGVVAPPRLRMLAPGSFATVRQRLLLHGISEFHLKFPQISEERQFLAGLTVEQEVRLPDDDD